ncbi:hypothetical protein T492DRAFT_877931 [Pavlovales sp. CCMP2436]|nr:hypothetical protein T492DRAFT_877931 [Pavlovales sp. CCMP2436]
MILNSFGSARGDGALVRDKVGHVGPGVGLAAGWAAAVWTPSALDTIGVAEYLRMYEEHVASSVPAAPAASPVKLPLAPVADANIAADVAIETDTDSPKSNKRKVVEPLPASENVPTSATRRPSARRASVATSRIPKPKAAEPVAPEAAPSARATKSARTPSKADAPSEPALVDDESSADTEIDVDVVAPAASPSNEKAAAPSIASRRKSSRISDAAALKPAGSGIDWLADSPASRAHKLEKFLAKRKSEANEPAPVEAAEVEAEPEAAAEAQPAQAAASPSSGSARGLLLLLAAIAAIAAGVAVARPDALAAMRAGLTSQLPALREAGKQAGVRASEVTELVLQRASMPLAAASASSAAARAAMVGWSARAFERLAQSAEGTFAGFAKSAPPVVEEEEELAAAPSETSESEMAEESSWVSMVAAARLVANAALRPAGSASEGAGGSAERAAGNAGGSAFKD